MSNSPSPQPQRAELLGDLDQFANVDYRPVELHSPVPSLCAPYCPDVIFLRPPLVQPTRASNALSRSDSQITEQTNAQFDTPTESPDKEYPINLHRAFKATSSRWSFSQSFDPPLSSTFGPLIYETVMLMMTDARLGTTAVSSDLAIAETTFVGGTTCHHRR
ncbi:hypothetical protein ARMSODRAFT_1089232 [Armillaria solidipes]|uniref:Uncharacterized protein n=1 Tax=Armillaria solidipes TaxID=1076256 RepID=A0A2H3AU32_9AGAR|nr:hypothetical protein ARMSODRAFT_1089232 [Armillaria solidipes]